MRKTILITGSSSGIGKVTAKLFHEKGWNVIATMRTPGKEQELTGLENVVIARLDVQDHKSIHDAVQLGIQRFGKIDVLLNNAGYGAYGPLEATSIEKIRRQFDVNVIGLLEVTKAILPHFRQNKDGMVINISSIAGKMAFPLGSLYHGTKFAVEGISEALSFEMEQICCKVKIVEPGMTNTDFKGRSFDFNNDASLVEYQGLVGKLFKALESLSHTFSDPIVVANVIYQAATDGTDQLRYVAGETAKEMVADRRKLDDGSFIEGMKAKFGLQH